jgi:hypothetical protein
VNNNHRNTSPTTPPGDAAAAAAAAQLFSGPAGAEMWQQRQQQLWDYMAQRAALPGGGGSGGFNKYINTIPATPPPHELALQQQQRQMQQLQLGGRGGSTNDDGVVGSRAMHRGSSTPQPVRATFLSTSAITTAAFNPAASDSIPLPQDNFYYRYRRMQAAAAAAKAAGANGGGADLALVSLIPGSPKSPGAGVGDDGAPVGLDPVDAFFPSSTSTNSVAAVGQNRAASTPPVVPSDHLKQGPQVDPRGNRSGGPAAQSGPVPPAGFNRAFLSLPIHEQEAMLLGVPSSVLLHERLRALELEQEAFEDEERAQLLRRSGLLIAKKKNADSVPATAGTTEQRDGASPAPPLAPLSGPASAVATPQLLSQAPPANHPTASAAAALRRKLRALQQQDEEGRHTAPLSLSQVQGRHVTPPAGRRGVLPLPSAGKPSQRGDQADSHGATTTAVDKTEAAASPNKTSSGDTGDLREGSNPPEALLMPSHHQSGVGKWYLPRQSVVSFGATSALTFLPPINADDRAVGLNGNTARTTAGRSSYGGGFLTMPSSPAGMEYMRSSEHQANTPTTAMILPTLAQPDDNSSAFGVGASLPTGASAHALLVSVMRPTGLSRIIAESRRLARAGDDVAPADAAAERRAGGLPASTSAAIGLAGVRAVSAAVQTINAKGARSATANAGAVASNISVGAVGAVQSALKPAIRPTGAGGAGSPTSRVGFVTGQAKETAFTVASTQPTATEATATSTQNASDDTVGHRVAPSPRPTAVAKAAAATASRNQSIVGIASRPSTGGRSQRPAAAQQQRQQQSTTQQEFRREVEWLDQVVAAAQMVAPPARAATEDDHSTTRHDLSMATAGSAGTAHRFGSGEWDDLGAPHPTGLDTARRQSRGVLPTAGADPLQLAMENVQLSHRISAICGVVHPPVDLAEAAQNGDVAVTSHAAGESTAAIMARVADTMTPAVAAAAATRRQAMANVAEFVDMLDRDRFQFAVTRSGGAHFARGGQEPQHAITIVTSLAGQGEAAMDVASQLDYSSSSSAGGDPEMNVPMRVARGVVARPIVPTIDIVVPDEVRGADLEADAPRPDRGARGARESAAAAARLKRQQHRQLRSPRSDLEPPAAPQTILKRQGPGSAVMSVARTAAKTVDFSPRRDEVHVADSVGDSPGARRHRYTGGDTRGAGDARLIEQEHRHWTAFNPRSGENRMQDRLEALRRVRTVSRIARQAQDFDTDQALFDAVEASSDDSDGITQDVEADWRPLTNTIFAVCRGLEGALRGPSGSETATAEEEAALMRQLREEIVSGGGGARAEATTPVPSAGETAATSASAAADPLLQSVQDTRPPIPPTPQGLPGESPSLVTSDALLLASGAPAGLATDANGTSTTAAPQPALLQASLLSIVNPSRRRPTSADSRHGAASQLDNPAGDGSPARQQQRAERLAAKAVKTRAREERLSRFKADLMRREAAATAFVQLMRSLAGYRCQEDEQLLLRDETHATVARAEAASAAQRPPPNDDDGEAYVQTWSFMPSVQHEQDAKARGGGGIHQGTASGALVPPTEQTQLQALRAVAREQRVRQELRKRHFAAVMQLPLVPRLARVAPSPERDVKTTGAVVVPAGARPIVTSNDAMEPHVSGGAPNGSSATAGTTAGATGADNHRSVTPTERAMIWDALRLAYRHAEPVHPKHWLTSLTRLTEEHSFMDRFSISTFSHIAYTAVMCLEDLLTPRQYRKVTRWANRSTFLVRRRAIVLRELGVPQPTYAAVNVAAGGLSRCVPMELHDIESAVDMLSRRPRRRLGDEEQRGSGGGSSARGSSGIQMASSNVAAMSSTRMSLTSVGAARAPSSQSRHNNGGETASVGAASDRPITPSGPSTPAVLYTPLHNRGGTSSPSARPLRRGTGGGPIGNDGPVSGAVSPTFSPAGTNFSSSMAGSIARQPSPSKGDHTIQRGRIGSAAAAGGSSSPTAPQSQQQQVTVAAMVQGHHHSSGNSAQRGYAPPRGSTLFMQLREARRTADAWRRKQRHEVDVGLDTDSTDDDL